VQRAVAVSLPRVALRPVLVRRFVMLVALAALGAANLLGLARLAAEVGAVGVPRAVDQVGFDWVTFSEAGSLATIGANPYVASEFRWSPAAAWLLYWITLVPWPVWQLAHVAAALVMPSWRLRALTLLAYPFWYDVMVGNVMVFVALLAVWTCRGSRWATAGFLVIAVLAPRPLMIPIVAWVLWRQPEWRLPAGLMAAGALVGSLLVGHVGAWIVRLAESRSQLEEVVNLAPSVALGAAWIPIGIALAAMLVWRRRAGWAAVVIQPYLIPNYLLMLAVEADQGSGDASSTTMNPSSSRATQNRSAISGRCTPA